MRYAETVQALDAFATLPIDSRPPRTGVRMRRLLDGAGSPDAAVRTIVVAGTCGKGSTATMIASILRAAGHRVGLFTGPHLERWTERIRFGDRDVDDETFARYVTEALDAARALAADGDPAHRASLVEVLALAALRWFRDQRADYAVMEAGVGGRRDYTMALSPVACVLTAIDLDHTHLLGGTIAEVATDKAGIARPGIPLICSALHPDALGVVEDRCEQVGAPLHLLERDFQRVRSSLIGPHQEENAAAAAAVAQVLGIGEEAVREGLCSARMPGRLEWLGTVPPVLLDGAHQPAGARALRHFLDAEKRPVVLVLGVLADKDREGIAAVLAPAAARVIVTAPPYSERAGDLEPLVRAVEESRVPCTPIPDLREALERAKAEALNLDGMVCVAGSLYLVGEARSILNK